MSSRARLARPAKLDAVLMIASRPGLGRARRRGGGGGEALSGTADGPASETPARALRAGGGGKGLNGTAGGLTSETPARP